jgi:hypothetical protein
VHSVGVAAGGDEQRGGDIGADPELGEQDGRRVGRDGGDSGVEFGDLGREVLPSACY